MNNFIKILASIETGLLRKFVLITAVSLNIACPGCSEGLV